MHHAHTVQEVATRDGLLSHVAAKHGRPRPAEARLQTRTIEVGHEQDHDGSVVVADG